jgi:UDPglucose 6-dehydrogenase
MAGADALILVTEWNEFRALDLGRVKALLRQPLVIDLRNIYQPDEMTLAGLAYHSIGRPARRAGGEPPTEQSATAKPATGKPAGLRAIA